MLVNSEFSHRSWQPIRPMEVESFWLGFWRETFNRTSRLSITVTEPKENVYYCPEGKALHYRGRSLGSRGNLYCSTEVQCSGCPQKKLCTPGLTRRLFVHWEEPARQTVRALAGTPDYKRSQRERYKVEALFAELKQQIKLRKVRLRRLWKVAEQFYLAATAQNLKRLTRHLAQKQSPELCML